MFCAAKYGSRPFVVCGVSPRLAAAPTRRTPLNVVPPGPWQDSSGKDLVSPNHVMRLVPRVRPGNSITRDSLLVLPVQALTNCSAPRLQSPAAFVLQPHPPQTAPNKRGGRKPQNHYPSWSAPVAPQSVVVSLTDTVRLVTIPVGCPLRGSGTFLENSLAAYPQRRPSPSDRLRRLPLPRSLELCTKIHIKLGFPTIASANMGNRIVNSELTARYAGLAQSGQRLAHYRVAPPPPISQAQKN